MAEDEEEIYDFEYWEKQEKDLLRALKQKGEENWTLPDWIAYLGRVEIRLKDVKNLKARMSQMPFWDIVEMWVTSQYDEEFDDFGVGAFAEKKSLRTNDDAGEFCNELSCTLEALLDYGFLSIETARTCLAYSTGAKGAQAAANEFYNFMTVYGCSIRLSGKFTIDPKIYKAAIKKEGGINAREVTPETRQAS